MVLFLLTTYGGTGHSRTPRLNGGPHGLRCAARATMAGLGALVETPISCLHGQHSVRCPRLPADSAAEQDDSSFSGLVCHALSDHGLPSAQRARAHNPLVRFVSNSTYVPCSRRNARPVSGSHH